MSKDFMEREARDVTTWKEHSGGCDKCGTVNVEDVKTFQRCCVQGASKLLDHVARLHAKNNPKPPTVRAENYASKDDVRARMKYVEPK